MINTLMQLSRAKPKTQYTQKVRTHRPRGTCLLARTRRLDQDFYFRRSEQLMRETEKRKVENVCFM